VEEAAGVLEQVARAQQSSEAQDRREQRQAGAERVDGERDADGQAVPRAPAAQPGDEQSVV
jgi:hypothetical protein